MWVKAPDFFVQSSDDLKIIKASYMQACIWLANMGFDTKGDPIQFYIYDALLRCNILTAKMSDKKRPLYWKEFNERKI